VTEPTLLERLLAPGALTVVFQPILEAQPEGWRVHAYEALVRGPRGTNAESADVMFEYVRRKRAEPVVDRECFARALETVAQLPGEPPISLNVHASTLGRDRDFPAFVADAAARHGIATRRLMIEIVEHAPCWNGPSFVSALGALREQGMRVALDDIGLGQSNYRMILECRPDCFKVDRYIVTGAGADPHHQAVLRSIEQLARSFGALTVAEGIVACDDLEAVLEAGITLVQGFLLAPPAPAADIASGRALDSVQLGDAAALRPLVCA
jgi:EAL domain-containing protein (putative c-di-GMP-specific phosphodiesterase class I)